jgi:hypothetical protein
VDVVEASRVEPVDFVADSWGRAAEFAQKLSFLMVQNNFLIKANNLGAFFVAACLSLSPMLRRYPARTDGKSERLNFEHLFKYVEFVEPPGNAVLAHFFKPLL